jgi:hypothetical protein
MPVPAMLTWPLMLIVGIAAVTLRALVWVARRIPPRRRAPAALAVLAVAGAAVVLNAIQPTQAPEIRRSRSDQDQDQPDSCAVLGYSTVKGEGLRGQQGGIRSFLDHDCQQCRHRTAGIFAGGETLAWLRDNYCGSPPSFGADGHVYVLGGANDDFLWGVLSIARLFIIGQQGVTPWRRNQVSAAAASRAQIDAQTSALADLIRCARSRGAQLLFLHDFLATDLSGGRGDDRAAMLARRQAVVETAGGSFADLLSVFANEVGISWFNDYVHLSLVAHERVADLACRRSLTPPHRAVTSDAQ